eukprot:376815-Pyramimonas_sp.AAC.1
MAAPCRCRDTPRADRTPEGASHMVSVDEGSRKCPSSSDQDEKRINRMMKLIRMRPGGQLHTMMMVMVMMMVMMMLLMMT